MELESIYQCCLLFGVCLFTSAKIARDRDSYNEIGSLLFLSFRELTLSDRLRRKLKTSYMTRRAVWHKNCFPNKTAEIVFLQFDKHCFPTLEC